MPRHLALTLAAIAALLFSSSALLSWLSVQWRLPLVEDLMVRLHLQETRKTQAYLSNNLQLMATRLGELQAKVMQLDLLGDRVANLAGVKRSDTGHTRPGQGGPFLPEPLDHDTLQQAMERLTHDIDRHTDELAILESRLLEKRVRDRRLPTTLPVKNALLGSPFGHRVDPIAGLPARHEGMDFNAETGTPVVAAADGVVIAAAHHPEFGNMVDIDHGEGLTSRYAHLSRIDTRPGAVIARGAPVGAVGNTGRSTGAHLHFEVRMFGAAQNPAHFLKQGQEFAQLSAQPSPSARKR